MPKFGKLKSKAKSPSPKASKSVEVKVQVPLSSTSFMTVVLIGLVSLMVYSGYLGVKSLWNFTHPKFNISADAFRILPELVASGHLPNVPTVLQDSTDPNISAKRQNYLRKVAEFEQTFKDQFPGSKLLIVSDNDLINMGEAFCKAKADSIQATGTYSRTEMINAFKAKFVVQYPNVGGLTEYLTGIGNAAFDSLCGGK